MAISVLKTFCDNNTKYYNPLRAVGSFEQKRKWMELLITILIESQWPLKFSTCDTITDMEISFRVPTGADVDAVYAVYQRTWLATYPNEALGITLDDIHAFIPEKMSDEQRSKQIAVYAHIPEGTFIMIALADENIVGACSGIRKEESTHLKSLYILPEYQGKGIGFALWEQFKAWAGTEKLITVHVATYNTNAINFYTSVGFVDTGKRFVEERFIFKGGAQMPEMEMVLEK